jgi:hypothetical protein
VWTAYTSTPETPVSWRATSGNWQYGACKATQLSAAQLSPAVRGGAAMVMITITDGDTDYL